MKKSKKKLTEETLKFRTFKMPLNKENYLEFIEAMQGKKLTKKELEEIDKEFLKEKKHESI